VWRIPAEVFLRLSTGTQVSDAVKFNMADRVHRLSLTASNFYFRHHFQRHHLERGRVYDFKPVPHDPLPDTKNDLLNKIDAILNSQ
jgi:hypothetical protein